MRQIENRNNEIKLNKPNMNNILIPAAFLKNCEGNNHVTVRDELRIDEAGAPTNASSNLMTVKDPLTGYYFAIDTGRSYSFIPKNYYKKKLVSNGTVEVWSGECIKTYGKVKIDVSLGTPEKFNCSFLVADVDCPSLGGDFLEKFNAVVDYREGTLKFGNSNKCVRASRAPLAPNTKISNIRENVITKKKCSKDIDEPVMISVPFDDVETVVTNGVANIFARPAVLHIEDKLSGMLYVIDTGACRSVLPAKPSDYPNRTFELGLKAANGSAIPSYGTRNVKLDFGLGRVYDWEFVIAKVETPLLGIDFIKAFRWCINAESDVILDNETLQKMQCNLSDNDRRILTEYALLSGVSNCKYAKLLSKFPKLTTLEANDKAKHDFKHYIVTPNTPVYCKARPLSPELYRIAKAGFDKLLADGIVSPATSEWCSPLHMVLKPDGTYRLVGDYRRLNNITARDVYPLPFLQTFTADLYGMKIFSKLDLKDAFLQIPVAEQDKEKTSISTPFGAFSYNFMPFGLSGAAQSFQRFINEVMRNVKSEKNVNTSKNVSTFCYIDDILVASESEEEHCCDLKAVFKRLSDFGLRINQQKCEFGRESLDFLGHHIDEEGIRPLHQKVSAITEMSCPNTIKELRRYLGMMNFYRRFVPKAAETMIPMYDLLIKNNKMPKNSQITWTPEAVSSFNNAKDDLARATLLAYPAPDAELYLAADASDTAIGAVLQQRDPKTGDLQPLGFFSRRLAANQKRWTVFSRELFAVYSGLKHFLYFLRGRRFTILTDHKALINAASKAGERESSREIRHLHFISEYSSNWEHIPGTKNITADTLSRARMNDMNKESVTKGNPVCCSVTKDNTLVKNRSEDINDSHYYYISTLDAFGDEDKGNAGKLQYVSVDLKHIEHDQLRKEQACDDELKVLLRAQSERNATCELVLVNGLYCHICEEVARPFIPISMRRRVFHLTHDIAHPSAARTVKLIIKRFFWPNMKKNITCWSKACEACQAAKVHRHNIAPVITMVPASEKFGSVHVDYVGPLPHCNGSEYLMTAIDRYSRWVEAIPLPNSTAETTADCFITHWVSRFGIPESITTDRGRNFQSELFNRLLIKLGCKHYSTTSYRPEHNGIIERFHRTVKDSLRASCKNNDWVSRLPLILLLLRTSPRSDGQPSAAEIVYGDTLRLPVDLLIPPKVKEYLDPCDYVDKLRTHMQEINPIVTKHNVSKNKRFYVEKGLKNASKVYIKNMAKKGLEPNYSGPYDVIQLEDKYITIRRKNGRTDTVSIDNAKSCYTQDDILLSPLENVVIIPVEKPEMKYPDYVFDDRGKRLNKYVEIPNDVDAGRCNETSEATVTPPKGGDGTDNDEVCAPDDSDSDGESSNESCSIVETRYNARGRAIIKPLRYRE